MKYIINLLNIFISTSVLACEIPYKYLHSDVISRWGFQQFANFIYMPVESHFFESKIYTFDPELVQKGDIIFMDSTFASDFLLYIHPKIKNPYILITHVYDWEMPGYFLGYLDDPKLAAWFCINASVQYHPKVFPIPIGILQLPWVEYQKNEYKELFKQLKNHAVKDKLLYMNFAINTYPSERQTVYNLFHAKSFCFQGSYKTFNQYLEEMAHCKFVLSPRGAGLDCYRTWEALLVGSIPIVKHSNLDPLYQDLPVLIVDHWDMITEEFLNKKYIEITNRKYNFKKLTAGYWLRQIIQQRLKIKKMH